MRTGLYNLAYRMYYSPMNDTITLTQSLKDRVVAAIAGEFDEFAPEDADKVRAVPVGTVIQFTLSEDRYAWLGDYPDDATGEELVSLACDHFGIHPAS
jgi:hypothetical protein